MNKSGLLFIALTSIFIVTKVGAQEAPINELGSQEMIVEEEMITIGEQRIDKTVIDVDTERLFSIAGAGEDPLQALFALPGVTFSEEGEPVIRGSAPGDNSYYIDFLPASNLYHIFGNSIFNKYVIQDFDLYPAAFSSQYGNATGGVIDVTLRDPVNQPLTTTFSASLFQSAFMVESGITENQAFYFSIRQSLLDKFFDEDTFSEEDEGFIVSEMPISRDYQAKYLWSPNEQHSVTLVAAGSADDAGAELTDQSNEVQVDPDFAGPIDYTEGFDSQGIVWNWRAPDGARQLSSTLTHIDDEVDLFYGAGQFLKINENTIAIRLDYEQQIFAAHNLKLGVLAESTDYDIDANLKFVNCSDFDPDCPTVDVEIIPYETSFDVKNTTLYLEDEFQLNSAQTITLGVHYSDDDYLKTSRLEPRLRWDYQLNGDWSTYFALGQYSQLPDLEFILEDVGNPNLDTVKANHFVWGVSNQLFEDWSWKADIYHKDISDLVISIDDPEAADFDLSYTNQAEGEAYGVEFQIDKAVTEKWDGWLALSLGKAERTDLRNNETIPFDYDRPVMLDVVVNFRPSKNWSLGWKWTYQTGDRYTPIVDVATNENNPDILEPIYGERNSQTAPAYHRLDFRAEYKKPTEWGHWSLYIDLVNAYGRENISGYEFAPNGVDVVDTPPKGFGENVPVQTEVSAGALPSLGFEIRF